MGVMSQVAPKKKPRRLSRRERLKERKNLDRARLLYEQGAFAPSETLYDRIFASNEFNLEALRGLADATISRSQQLSEYGDTRFIEGLCTIAQECYSQGLYLEAHRCYIRVLELAPDRAEAVWGVAECHVAFDELTDAIAGYRRYLELVPGEPEALHMLGALGDDPPPTRASDGYITAYFDRFADDFDHQLLNKLEYLAPDLLYAALMQHFVEGEGALDILDLGCGTGLTGRLLKPHAGRLDGVDLSGAMLEKARTRKLYDRLVLAEIVSYLTEVEQKYDILVAGDVLAYFGSLSGILRGVARVLREGGVFAFSVEVHRGSGFRLTPSGRYAHAREYIRRLATSARLREVSVGRAHLRYEYGDPVVGDIWILERLSI